MSRFKMPWAITFPTFINALSIPLIAGILIWVLTKVLDADAWCSAQAELTSRTTPQELLRCGQILLRQLDIGFWVAVGLVGTLSLAHLVSVIREAKAGLELSTKLGSLKVGGDNAEAAADHVVEGAQHAADEVKG